MVVRTCEFRTLREFCVGFRSHCPSHKVRLVVLCCARLLVNRTGMPAFFFCWHIQHLPLFIAQ